MRNVIFSMNISIDACYDHTAFNAGAHIHKYFTDQIKETGTMIFGRNMYNLMFPYWSEMAVNKDGTADENDFAEAITAAEKIVFSTTLTSVGNNTTLLRGNLVEELLKLKQQPGKPISISSISLRNQLMAAGLIDEFYFVVHPVIVGKGKRLFEDDNFKTLYLKLADTTVLSSGAVVLHYVR